MTETIKQLFERKSVRAFEQREIAPAERESILAAACMAPTAGNQQLYTIIDAKDGAVKARLAELCDHQPFIAKSKLALVFCADCQKWYDAYEDAGCEPRTPGLGDLMLSVCDASIAAQNAVTAAWSLGIGSCYIGDVMENCEEVRELLKLPEYVFPAAMVVFGYPTEQQKARRKPERADLRHIVHDNAYRRMGAAELRELLSKNCPRDEYRSWLKAFCDRKYNSDFSREMTRSAEKYADSFRRR